METTSVSTKVTKIDLKTILDNYREPSFWCKQWTIIDTKEIGIVWRMTSIDVDKGVILSKLDATKINIVRDGLVYKDMWWSSCTWDLPNIPINNSDFTQEHFESMIYSSLMHLLRYIENRCIYYYDDYDKYISDCARVQKELKKEAEIRLDNQNVTDELMRKSYIEAYANEHMTKVREYSFKILEHYEYHVIPDTYKYVASLFDRVDDLAKYYSMDMSIKGPHSKEMNFDEFNI